MAFGMKLIIQHGDNWFYFEDPVEILTARTPDEVFQCLEAIVLRQKEGLWAAGFVSYEAAGAFDEALKTHETGDFPLLQFGLFHSPSSEVFGATGTYELGEWRPSVGRNEYVEAIEAIKEHIAAGDTYQVNYTFRLNADFKGDPFAFFCDLTEAQQGGAGGTPAVHGGYGAYIETDDFAICSASPELFFELKDGVVTSRPMKGTRSRGLTFSDDRRQAEALRSSAKDCAENIMIVDMIRNDIGRVAAAGSVETVSCFDVEKYPTVWQMTSTVKGDFAQGRKDATLADVMRALFPCASITGAPKAKTMEIIRELETSVRGIYTGSIGFIAPDGEACFNVAIRTAVLDRNTGKMEYGIGGGVVWDSDADAEYEEALSKARILASLNSVPQRSCFQCLETMLWEDGEIFLLERHLKRLAETAEYFDFQFNSEDVAEYLRDLWFDYSARIRLLLSKDGSFETQIFQIKRDESVASMLAIAKEPVDSKDLFLYHKTTNRMVYENAKADFPDADDVLLFNERGEVTESCIANVVVEFDGRRVTPPVSCGLLAGTFRNELLEAGEIEERVVLLDDLKRADAVWLINSVRKWRPVLIEGIHAYIS